MSQRYNDDTKRPKSKENQLEILKIYAFCQKIQQRASGLGESAVGVLIYLSMRIQPKSRRIFPARSCRNFTQWFMEGRSCSILVT